MTLSIRTVKREIRVLGLDTCGKEVFGAIVRGGLFLDGVIRFPLPTEHLDRKLATGILATRYYPELRAVMLHDSSHLMKPAILEKLAGLPVMEVTTAKQKGKRYDSYQSPRGTLRYLTHLPRKTAESILSMTWTSGRLPEPARVAHLLARTSLGSSSHFPQHPFWQKAQNEPLFTI